MPVRLDSFYAQWRVRCGAVPLLREDHDSPPERLLQTIWQHQRLLREQLRTLDGQAVRVLHPGFQNVEGGPDFRNALIQFGDDTPRTGDVEVDLRSSGWHAHGHDHNPAFDQAVLHVVWDSERRAAGAPPTLVLRQVLDAPLGELSLWLGGEPTQTLAPEHRGRCCAPLARLEPESLSSLLHQAAQVRLRSKAAQFQARARQAGWEQALWEGLFRALGYKHNVWPMQHLAELRDRWLDGPSRAPGGSEPARPPDDPDRVPRVQARLLGLSGLLPAELGRRQSTTDSYLRTLWDFWWRDRNELSDGILPRKAWRLHGLRPANHPERRLALAAAWAVGSGLADRLDQWADTEIGGSGLPGSLCGQLQVATDGFWSWHWTLRSARLKKEQPLLGIARVTDVAVNVVLPWLWGRALDEQDQPKARQIERRYFLWPAAEDNAVLRLARARLLGGKRCSALRGAAAQQGLMQMVRDFCDHSNAICENCKLPDLVRQWYSHAQLTA